MIDGADLLDFVEDQLITLVEKERAKLLLVSEGHRGSTIVDDARPGRQHRPFFDLTRASRLAAAWTTLSSVMTASPIPLVSASRAGGAEITSGNDPNLAIRSSASGFTSRCGMARNSTSSTNS
jgi:hypothetical protein